MHNGKRNKEQTIVTLTVNQINRLLRAARPTNSEFIAIDIGQGHNKHLHC